MWVNQPAALSKSFRNTAGARFARCNDEVENVALAMSLEVLEEHLIYMDGQNLGSHNTWEMKQHPFTSYFDLFWRSCG